MGLLNTEVETGIGGNISYYESLGYEIPRRLDSKNRYLPALGAVIKIKVEHLKPNSQTIVDVECDYCHKRQSVKYKQYYNSIHSDIGNGKYLCASCSRLLKRGENHHSWNPNLTDKDRASKRYNEEYTNFVKTVMARDNYTCQCCGKRSTKKMVAHHLNGYNWCIEERVNPNNGITLCENCHMNYHSIYGYGDNTKEQFEKWIGHALFELKEYNGKLPSARQVYCIEDNKIYKNAYAVAEDLELVNAAQVYYACNHEIKKARYKTKDGTVKSFDKIYYTIKGKHYVWYDEYLKMSPQEIEKTLNKKLIYKRQIICTTTEKVFNSISDAAKFYNIRSSSHITSCCKGKRQTCGQLPDGTRLQWMYYDDYLNNINQNLKEAS